MPTPRAGESKDEYMGRCIPIVVAEGKSQKQAIAQCAGMYERGARKGKDMGILDFLRTKARRRDKLAQPSTFHVEKDRNGVYRWFAVFSNKFRDRDNPAEILSAAAHKDFVRAVDAGEWPMPELWLWHVKGSRVGVAEWIAYDENSGFTMGAGIFEDEHTARALAAYKGALGVSHGMPRKEIERSRDDPTVITRYRTREISPLPLDAAANILTSFDVKEVDMSLPDNKKQYLRELGWSEDRIAQVENSLKGLAGVADTLGLESKGVDEVEQVEQVDEAAQVEQVEQVDEAAEPAKEQIDEVAQVDEVVEQVEQVEQVDEVEQGDPGKSVEPDDAFKEQVVDAIAQVLGLVKQQGEQVKELAQQINELKQRQGEGEGAVEVKEGADLDLTPAASVFDLAKQRAIGTVETEIDGRTKLAKQGPAQAPDRKAGPTGIGFLDALATAPTD